jgi:hypothetical protein
MNQALQTNKNTLASLLTAVLERLETFHADPLA